MPISLRKGGERVEKTLKRQTSCMHTELNTHSQGRSRAHAQAGRRLIHNIMGATENYLPKAPDNQNDLKAEYSKISERRVRLGILLSDIARTNNLQVTREEISAAVMGQARQYPGQEDKIFEFYRKNPNEVNELRGPILEEKAVDYILGKVQRTAKPVTIEELMNDDEDASSSEAKPAKKKAAKK